MAEIVQRESQILPEIETILGYPTKNLEYCYRNKIWRIHGEAWKNLGQGFDASSTIGDRQVAAAAPFVLDSK